MKFPSTNSFLTWRLSVPSWPTWTLFCLFFYPGPTPVHDLWFVMTKLNQLARWVQCASYVVWCATSDQSHATWCLRRFIRRPLQMEKIRFRSFLAEQLWLLNVISSPLTSPLERWFAFATDGAIWVPHKPWIIFLIVLWTKLSSTQPIAAPYIGCPCAILGLQTLYATVSPLLSSLKRRTGLPHCHHILPWAPVAGQGARQVRSGAEPSRWLAIHQTGSSLLIAFGCIWLCAGLYLVHIWLRLMLSHFKCSEML